MRFLHQMCEEAHGPAHVGIDAMKMLCAAMWHPDLNKVIEQTRLGCEICNQFNPKATVRTEQGAFPIRAPGKEIIIDFTDMGERTMNKRYLLVMVDACSGWPEAYPIGQEDDNAAVQKALITQIMGPILRANTKGKWRKLWEFRISLGQFAIHNLKAK